MCGIFGVFNSKEAASDTFYGLYALQHRGQEAAGIVVADYEESKKRAVFRFQKDFGLVSEIFSDEDFEKLTGRAAIGHNRYSTSGSAKLRQNIQPFSVNYKSGHLALAHNGTFTNARQLRSDLREKGVIFQATSDSELVLHLAARSTAKKPEEQIFDALSQIQGAYSIVILTDTQLIAARDPYGVRPLSLGIKKQSDSNADCTFVLASETCAFDIISAEYVREVEPGEIMIIDRMAVKTQEPRSLYLPKSQKRARCIFEFVYFSRPDSIIFNESVDKVRRKLGKNLAIESKIKPAEDENYLTVISVPDSSNTAALGFVTESNKHNVPARMELGLIRNHYVGRTFIHPGAESRELKVRSKYNIVRGVLKNRRIIVVDDSIVRGTTSKMLVKLLKEAQPKEIHLHISSPQIISPCFYGMDFPTRDQLIASMLESENDKIRKYLDVDSLTYLSHEGLLNSVPKHEDEESSYCTACFSGSYPIAINGANTDKYENDD
ncbi:amidophosphoribosyltransferase [Chloroherpeton thalassium ATCC 35110]|uniref:Amidophosphoribosyltransferase n=1 Tax=Chloroherpeton thalassium (strain ATCC 35110 / GB-78) TaxID=517418 RepID=B3QWB2_CHLT3|nr:amidophosphoribosyltransferase [Chloroherpeton thalassium]ACF13225.1 amidophosphoribosyltransferase [Chloroherpeton thalassium ATCC 35110]